MAARPDRRPGQRGAITAAVLIWAFGWEWADPVASIVIGLLVVYSSWRLLAESVSVLLESAPKGIDVDEVYRTMRGVPVVLAVLTIGAVAVFTALSGGISGALNAVIGILPK